MDKIVKKFIDSNDSLYSFCLENNLTYMKLYKFIKKNYPDLITRKNNGKSKRSRMCQSSTLKLMATKEELEKLFFIDKLGQREISELYGVSKSLVSMKMKAYGIDVKSAGQSRYWNDDRREHFKKLANSGKIGVFRHSNWKYHSTSIEKYFIDEANKLGIKYKRQYAIEKYGHQYDFFIKQYNLLVEMDGEYFHNFPNQKIKDSEQMDRAKILGYNIVRITDTQIKTNKNIIAETLNGFNQAK